MYKQEIRANAHETRESQQQFLFTGCFGLSPSICRNARFCSQIATNH